MDNGTKSIVEICCYNVESVRVSANAGAHRVELCSPAFTGGGSPAAEDITASKKFNLKVNVMLHPREGDYYYDKISFELLRAQILQAKKLGADGIVLGVNDNKDNVDVERTAELVKLCAPLEVTFHKAFELVDDPFRALDQLIEIGVKRVLTSGTKKTVLDGKEILKKLHEHALGRIIIMAGGGLRSSNIAEIYKLGIREFHSSALIGAAKVSSEEEIQKTLEQLSLVSKQ